MKVATHEERDRIFGFTPELFQRLEELQAADVSLEVLIAHLRQSGVPMPAASLALRKIHAVAAITDARSAVDESLAYANWPGADAAYPEIHRVYDEAGQPLDHATTQTAETLAA